MPDLIGAVILEPWTCPLGMYYRYNPTWSGTQWGTTEGDIAFTGTDGAMVDPAGGTSTDAMYDNVNPSKSGTIGMEFRAKFKWTKGSSTGHKIFQGFNADQFAGGNGYMDYNSSSNRWDCMSLFPSYRFFNSGKTYYIVGKARYLSGGLVGRSIAIYGSDQTLIESKVGTKSLAIPLVRRLGYYQAPSSADRTELLESYFVIDGSLFSDLTDWKACAETSPLSYVIHKQQFISYLPEIRKGSLSNGFVLYADAEDFKHGKYIDNVHVAANSRNSHRHISGGVRPQGNFSFSPRINDCVHVLMNCFQKNNGDNLFDVATFETGSRYYEFTPSLYNLGGVGSQHGTGTYFEDDGADKFYCSVLKRVPTSNGFDIQHFKSGLVNTLGLYASPRGFEAEVDMKFEDFSLGSEENFTYGGVSTHNPIPGWKGTFYYTLNAGTYYEVDEIEIICKNNLQQLDRVGGTNHAFEFGIFQVDGQLKITDEQKLLRFLDAAMERKNMTLLGTFHDFDEGTMVIELPKCEILPDNDSIVNDMTFQYKAFPLEDNSKGAISIKIWTKPNS